MNFYCFLKKKFSKQIIKAIPDIKVIPPSTNSLLSDIHPGITKKIQTCFKIKHEKRIRETYCHHYVR